MPGANSCQAPTHASRQLVSGPWAGRRPGSLFRAARSVLESITTDSPYLPTGFPCRPCEIGDRAEVL